MVFLRDIILSRLVPIIIPIATHIICEGKDKQTSFLTFVAYHSYIPHMFSGSSLIHDTYSDKNKAIPTVAYFPIVRQPTYTNTTETSNAERNHEPGNVVPKNKSFTNSRQPFGKPSDRYGLLNNTNHISTINQHKYNIAKRLLYLTSGAYPLYLLTY